MQRLPGGPADTHFISQSLSTQTTDVSNAGSKNDPHVVGQTLNT